MRILKETNGNCNLQLITDLKYQYSCIAYEDNKNIKSITILPDFIFVNQENIDIISISPFTQIFMNDLLSYDQRYNAIINSTIYLMDNSTYEIYNKLLCNITGKINGTQPKLKNKNLNLIVNLHSGQKFETELDCSIDNIGLENYLLNFKSNEILESNFKIAISFIDNNDILLINFINGTNSIIESNDTKNYKEQFFSKQTGLKPGVIVAIIIALLGAIASVLFLFYFFQKKIKVINNSNSSTIINLKN